jgi:hypothetical protein
VVACEDPTSGGKEDCSFVCSPHVGKRRRDTDAPSQLSTRSTAPMAREDKCTVVDQPSVPIQIVAHSPLLVSSGAVRICKRESIMAKLKKRMEKWGLSAAKSDWRFPY